jgi:hypothetical protein
MALLHQADLRPSKLELLAAWLPTREWDRGPAGAGLTRVAAYRFDDPAGEVGIETMLVRAGDGPVIQVPLTYRGAPLDGADRWLIGTMEHSVLGPRWVYDGCGDPVYAAALAATIHGNASQAEEFIEIDGELIRREPLMSVSGSGDGTADAPAIEAVTRVDDGDPTLIVTEAAELTVIRILDVPSSPAAATELTLTGTWPGQPNAVILASARRSG